MSTSFVEKGDHGFWAPDYLLEVWAYALANALESSTSPDINAYRAHLYKQAKTGFTGSIELGFDTVSDETARTLVSHFSELLQRWQTRPELLTAGSLNALGIGGPGKTFGDVPFEHVEALTQVIGKLLQGQWPWRVGDKEALPGAWLPD